ncbi:DNA invertase Pin-like site-specific DNA recombinase [Winogradskyella pacifica]|uniref:DNA invertase Pin-like site-specific DNA recombinase n=1 Tax=Winogradskyella pacifica TaxID=664642 RepID=A0A3D9N1M2_9FLAO|nr:recombinase family protein [Winogradskyella pacifica]REE25656.1 DNA invertase Pin-like site-specific DNA recombinase [Winogradskyella pacifica]
MSKRVLAIYARKSGSNKNDTSIEHQINGGLAYANKNGFDSIEYVDENISGTKGLDTFDVLDSNFSRVEFLDRPEFAQMIFDIKKEKINAIWVYNQDRIERSTNIWLMFATLVLDNKIDFIVNNQKINLNDPMTKMMSTIFSVFNEYYAMTTSLRVRPAHKTNAERGKTHGIVAYGYKRHPETGKYAINKTQEKIVKEIFNMYLQDSLGAYKIAKELNKRSIKTTYGAKNGIFKQKKNIHQVERKKEDTKWSGSSINGIIKNTIYKGYKYHGEVKVETPVIIEPEIWEKVNKILISNRSVGKRATYHYLLEDIIFCSHCGNILIGKKRLNSKESAYKCSTKQRDISICKKSRGLSIPKLETFIIKHLFENSALKEMLMEQPQDNNLIEETKDKINRANIKLSELKRKKANTLLLLDSGKLENPEEFVDLLNKVNRNISSTLNNIQLHTNRLDTLIQKKRRIEVKETIEGIASDYSFETLRRSVRKLVESIKLQYVDIDDKRYHNIYINYVGTKTTTMFRTNRSALNFDCIGIQKQQETIVEVSSELREMLSQSQTGSDMLEKYADTETDTFISVGHKLFNIQIEKDNLVLFD